MTRVHTENDAPSPGQNMHRLITALIEALPVFDKKIFDAAVAEVRERPRASLHYLFQNFGTDDPALMAMLCRILAEHGGPDVIDNLNAVVFDAESREETKVRANDLLDKLGQAIDPDVFAMSVADTGPYEDKLPSRIIQLLREKDVTAAVKKTRKLHRAERSILITDAIRQCPGAAGQLIEALAEDSEENALAAVAAIGAEKFRPGIALLRTLQPSASRALQKLIKKNLFDLRADGISIPQTEIETQPPGPVRQDTAADMPLYRALISEPSPSGILLVTVARTRADRRLKVFTVLVSLWKRGIREAALHVGMSRSSFERFIKSRADEGIVLANVPLEECCRMIARGIRVAKTFGTPLPFDFGVGKSLLGDVDPLADEFENPFFCSRCGRPLDPDTIERIRASAAYDNIPVETLCVECRNTPS